MSETVTPGDVTAAWAVAQVSELLDELPEDAQVPEYGTAAWLALRGEDPRRAAAIIAAAETWRQHEEERERLERLAEEDPAAWFAAATAEADAHASRLGRGIARAMEARAKAARAKFSPPRPVRAVPGWPVAIPGRPGWWRHCINGRQVDLPGRDVPEQHQEAA